MATITLIEKAREGRRAALASLHTRHSRDDKIVSIFAHAFDDEPLRETAPVLGGKIIAFRSRRAAPAAQPAAAYEAPSNVVRLAA